MTVCDLRPLPLSSGDDRRASNTKVAVDAKSCTLIERVIDTLLAYD